MFLVQHRPASSGPTQHVIIPDRRGDGRQHAVRGLQDDIQRPRRKQEVWLSQYLFLSFAG